MSSSSADDDDQARINAILDAALDELDSDDDEPRNIASKPPVATSAKSNDNKEPAASSPRPMGPPPPPIPSENKLIEDTIAELLDQNSDPDAVMGKMLEEMLRMSALQEQQQQVTTNAGSQLRAEQQQNQNSSKGKPATPAAKPSFNTELDEAISNLVKDMAKQSSVSSSSGDGAGSSPSSSIRAEDGAFDDVDDSFLQILQGFQQPGSPLDSDAVIDGMMEQLLAKELMYEPMKQVTLKFPQWLQERKDTLSEKEFKERTKQYKSFCELVHVYEKEPENTAKLMALMHDVHEYGQPPIEIIHEIAPGMELDEDGMPKSFDGMNEECRMM